MGGKRYAVGSKTPKSQQQSYSRPMFQTDDRFVAEVLVEQDVIDLNDPDLWSFIVLELQKKRININTQTLKNRYITNIDPMLSEIFDVELPDRARLGYTEKIRFTKKMEILGKRLSLIQELQRAELEEKNRTAMIASTDINQQGLDAHVQPSPVPFPSATASASTPRLTSSQNSAVIPSDGEYEGIPKATRRRNMSHLSKPNAKTFPPGRLGYKGFTSGGTTAARTLSNDNAVSPLRPSSFMAVRGRQLFSLSPVQTSKFAPPSSPSMQLPNSNFATKRLHYKTLPTTTTSNPFAGTQSTGKLLCSSTIQQNPHAISCTNILPTYTSSSTTNFSPSSAVTTATRSKSMTDGIASSTTASAAAEASSASFTIKVQTKIPFEFEKKLLSSSSVDLPEMKCPPQIFAGRTFVLLQSCNGYAMRGLRHIQEYLITLHGGTVLNDVKDASIHTIIISDYDFDVTASFLDSSEMDVYKSNLIYDHVTNEKFPDRHSIQEYLFPKPAILGNRSSFRTPARVLSLSVDSPNSSLETSFNTAILETQVSGIGLSIDSDNSMTSKIDKKTSKQPSENVVEKQFLPDITDAELMTPGKFRPDPSAQVQADRTTEDTGVAANSCSIPHTLTKNLNISGSSTEDEDCMKKNHLNNKEIKQNPNQLEDANLKKSTETETGNFHEDLVNTNVGVAATYSVLSHPCDRPFAFGKTKSWLPPVRTFDETPEDKKIRKRTCLSMLFQMAKNAISVPSLAALVATLFKETYHIEQSELTLRRWISEMDPKIIFHDLKSDFDLTEGMLEALLALKDQKSSSLPADP